MNYTPPFEFVPFMATVLTLTCSVMLSFGIYEGTTKRKILAFFVMLICIPIAICALIATAITLYHGYNYFLGLVV